MEEVTKRWWNGSWGRLTRRDVWLVRQTRWRVVARAGDTETGNLLGWSYDSLDDATAMVDRLLRASTSGQWREQQSGSLPDAAQSSDRDTPSRRHGNPNS
ncbi:hypothetical protein [Micromonospora sp. WMMD980]|uniref:hypothetical protein n=1 Tax=Micromonospora sp. WMMD980 TaxID=3016088 RepID=UPI002416288E|nr:hypothetical protein [Micromonospora sp. WMMD980]MDG4803615.1 hypothetical protein [Micromonospora sp. WMMD980]